MNPFEEKGIPLEQQIKPWSSVNVVPYDTRQVHPYTRCRVILMNGIEVESAMFLHQFARHTTDLELKQMQAMMRRIEQQQQKMVNWLIPASESTLEVTIGYEQGAVDLTADLARKEPDPYIKAALDFALLEDFDHLYRYANLLSMDHAEKAEVLVGNLTEVIPGRPTLAEHRFPMDDVRKHYDRASAELITKLHVATIVASEQQTMDFYMTVGNRYPTMVGRGLYLEIGQIEEQHVTHYESLQDPSAGWLDRLVLHDYNEAYLYWSCVESEVDPRIKMIWEEHLAMEIGHLHQDRQLVQRLENRDPTEMYGEFPEATTFHDNKAYVREVLASQVQLTTQGTEFVPVDQLPKDHRYFHHQEMVNNGGTSAPSVQVIDRHIQQLQMDYRFESEGSHPVEGLRSREGMSLEVGRK
jgi:hypothetical protein